MVLTLLTLIDPWNYDIFTDFAGRRFLDLFRAFLSKSIFVLALYRSPDSKEDGAKAILPYVYTCPNNDTILHARDRAFVFCNPKELDYAMHATEGFKIVLAPDQSEYLAENTTPYDLRSTKYNMIDLNTNTNNNPSQASSSSSVNETR